MVCLVWLSQQILCPQLYSGGADRTREYRKVGQKTNVSRIRGLRLDQRPGARGDNSDTRPRIALDLWATNQVSVSEFKTASITPVANVSVEYTVLKRIDKVSWVQTRG